jgi:hypothetical protein
MVADLEHEGVSLGAEPGQLNPLRPVLGPDRALTSLVLIRELVAPLGGDLESVVLRGLLGREQVALQEHETVREGERLAREDPTSNALAMFPRHARTSRRAARRSVAIGADSGSRR